MPFCQKLHKKIYNFINSFACVPSTHVQASLKGWPNNHVRGCILKKLLVQLSCLLVQPISRNVHVFVCLSVCPPTLTFARSFVLILF